MSSTTREQAPEAQQSAPANAAAETGDTGSSEPVIRPSLLANTTTRERMLVPILLLTSILVLGLSFVGYALFRDQMMAEIGEHLDSVASVQQSRLRDMVDHVLSGMRLVASRTQLRISLRDHLAGRDPGAMKKATRILEDARKSTPQFRVISVAGPDGKVLASTAPRRVGSNVGDEQFFQTGRFADSISQFYRLSDDEPRMIVSGPLRLGRAFLGVLIIEESTEKLSSLSRDYTGLRKTGETMLVRQLPDGSGEFLTALRFDPDAALRRRIQPDERVNPALVALQGEQVRLPSAIDYRGHEVIAVTRFLPDTRWGIVVKQDIAEILEPVAHVRNVLTGIAIVALIAAFLVAVLLSRMITAPISRLTQRAERIREQMAWDTGGGQRHRNEILTLETTLREMTDRLMDWSLSLEWEVAARTREIQDMNEKLAESETRFQLAVRGSRDGLWDWVDVTRDEMWWSPQLYDLVGRTKKECPASYEAFCGMVAHPPANEFRKTIALKVGSREDFELELELDTGEGGKRWFVMRGASIQVGTRTRMAGSLQDIHQQKIASAKLQESYMAVSQFAHLAAHDLRAPTNKIASMADRLEKRLQKVEDEKVGRFMDVITRNARYMGELIDSLLVYADASVKKTVRPVDVDKALAHVREMFTAQAKERGATLEFAAGCPPVLGTDVDITQIMQNLVGNALKFCEVSPHIRVGFEASGEHVVLSVADNGIGIAPEYQDKIFEPLERLHGKGDYEGHGLGLSIVRRIIEKLGGRIWLESTPGEGTTFFVRLRRADTDSGDAAESDA